MPGIVGLITSMTPEWATERLARMMGCLCHDANYTTGVWANEQCGVYIGWTEPAGTSAYSMPIKSAQGHACLIFSGEHFSAHKNRQNPGYLLDLWEDAPSFPATLNGRFHGLVADGRRGAAALFNDRYGMHRLYYHESDEAFYFSAEAKSILAVCAELRAINAQALSELISCGCVLENGTVFDRINALPPGSCWEFRNGSLFRKRTYFQPSEWEAQEPLDSESYYREF